VRKLGCVLLLILGACEASYEQPTGWPAKKSQVAADEPRVGELRLGPTTRYPTKGRVDASFGRAAERCPSTKLSESCVIEECQTYRPASAQAETGLITISTPAASDVTLNPPWLNGVWLDDKQNESGFAPGDPIVVRTEGGFDVPAFRVAFNAPTEVPQGILPTDHTTPVSIVRDGGRAWVTTWQATGANDPTSLRFDLYAGSVELTCEARASSGALVIPAEVIARLPAGEGWITITPQSTATTTAGDYEMNVVAVGASCSATLAIDFRPSVSGLVPDRPELTNR
jgi:hypothetical protein